MTGSTAQREIERAIARLRRIVRLEGLEEAVDAAVKTIVIPDAKIYPPERAGQRYVRTFRLRDSWAPEKARRAANAVVAAATNPTPYAAEVMGTEDQKPIHQGRWRTEKQVAEQNASKVRAALQRALTKRWKSR